MMLPFRPDSGWYERYWLTETPPRPQPPSLVQWVGRLIRRLRTVYDAPVVTEIRPGHARLIQNRR